MNRLALLAAAVLSMTGCAEPLHLMQRGPGVASPYSFWPPPPYSALWLPPVASSNGAERLGDVASQFGDLLNGSGYDDTRWLPIGSEYQHGFAVSTRLEQRDRDARASSERWSSLYPEPPTLRWLTFAQRPALPYPGHYRSFLIAFTDLPLPGGASAPVWNETTLIDGPGAPERRGLPASARARPITASYRFSVFEYRYDWDPQEKRGELCLPAAPPEHAWPATLASSQNP